MRHISQRLLSTTSVIAALALISSCSLITGDRSTTDDPGTTKGSKESAAAQDPSDAAAGHADGPESGSPRPSVSPTTAPSTAEALDPPTLDAPDSPDLRNASLPLPKGCIADGGTTASFTDGYASAQDSTGTTAFAYVRHPATTMSTSTGTLTLVPLECHREGKDLFHTDIAAYTDSLSLAGSIGLRDIDSGAEAGIIASITTSEGMAHLEWVNQEISDDRKCHLCSTGKGDADLAWTGSQFTSSGLRTSR